MAKLPEVFNASEVKDTGFGVLPAGAYIARITDSDYRTTNAGDGKYIKFEFTIMGGEYNSRKVWTNINWINPNEKAVIIGKALMKQICNACEKPEGIEDTHELHGTPMTIHLNITGDEKDKWGLQNNIKRVTTAEESAAENEDPF